LSKRGGDSSEPDEGGDRQSLPDLFVELIGDGRNWVNAEIAVYREEARRRLIIAGIGIGLIMLAAALVAGTLVTLLVSVVFALGPIVGAGWATTIVIAVALLIAAIAAQAGRLQLRKLTRGEKIGEGLSGTPSRD